MKRLITFMLAIALLLPIASVAMAGLVQVEVEPEQESLYANAYKVFRITGSKAIPVYDGPSAKSKVFAYAQPGDYLGYLTWWSDNQWIRTLFNGGKNAGWVNVNDLK